MLELVRKSGTARNLNRMLMAVGKDYKFFPRTFLLPADYTELKKEFGDKNRSIIPLPLPLPLTLTLTLTLTEATRPSS